MSSPPESVRLVLLWHHHQPDYRSARRGESLLPWVRLHATKDYLDMALRLERHPSVRSTFNFVPSLLDQLLAFEHGASDTLFVRLAQAPDSHTGVERDELLRRLTQVPRWALDLSPALAELVHRVERTGNPGASFDDATLIGFEALFLASWIDPMFHDELPVRTAFAAGASAGTEARDRLLELHRQLLPRVIPTYRALADRGQIELSCSPYYHPILPLLIDSEHAHRSRPDLVLPATPMRAPEDAEAQIRLARARHESVFGAAPSGMWPSEGAVSPEAVAIAARCGVRWLASDEHVLWRSLGRPTSARSLLYRPWQVTSREGAVSMLFRDHELSDRVGFVYSRWDAVDAARDLLERVRRIGREHGQEGTPTVTIALDGENCWEHYAGDGGPFLDALYAELERATDVRTCTVSEALATREPQELASLASGSWIDADYHIWIGHPEKNRAWELVVETRKMLLAATAPPADLARAWNALYAAEGSDWFWWFGDDHFTTDRPLFDQLFRESLAATWESVGREPPAALRQPIVLGSAGAGASQPIGLIAPVIDGRETHFYEWHEAGTLEAGSGGSMHRDAGRLIRLQFGFDAQWLYLRLDAAPGPPFEFEIELLAPRPGRLRVNGPAIEWLEPSGRIEALAGSRAATAEITELAVPRGPLGLEPGARLELVVHRHEQGRRVESLPSDGTLGLVAPGDSFPAEMWSA